MEKKKSGGQFKYEFPKLGDKFEYWTVIDETPVKERKNWRVLCKCKCGKETLVRISALQQGMSKGCPCRSGDLTRAKVIAEGDLSLTLYSRFRNNAKIRSFTWDVSIKYLWDLFVKQDGKCALSNIELKLEKSLNRIKGQANITASLDRIDSSKGYIEGNVQWVHKDVNYMKQDLDEDYFIKMCKLITKNKKEK